MSALKQFLPITTFIFDVDGVLTDSTVLLLENGLQARQMHIKDGLGLQMAIRNGYRVIILSGAESKPVADRFKYLGLTEVYLGVGDKAAFIESYLVKNGLDAKEIAFMGDDLPDLALLQLAGLPACPADAVTEVIAASIYVSRYKGGQGCVRDLIEKVLRVQNRWVYQTQITAK